MIVKANKEKGQKQFNFLFYGSPHKSNKVLQWTIKRIQFVKVLLLGQQIDCDSNLYTSNGIL